MSTVIVLLSGGLKSSVALAQVARSTDTPYALHLDYGQRAKEPELEAAQEVCRLFDTKLEVVRVEEVRKALDPNNRLSIANPEAPHEALDPYVPGLLTFMLLLAAVRGVEMRATSILFGAAFVERTFGPETSVTAVGSTESAIRQALSCGLKFRTPWLDKKPGEHISQALMLPDGRRLFRSTHSCLGGNRKACGVCKGCKLRAEAFKAAKTSDTLWAPKEAKAVTR